MPRAALAMSVTAQDTDYGDHQTLLPVHAAPGSGAPGEQSGRRTARGAACVAVAFVGIVVVSVILFAVNKAAVAKWFARVGDALERLPMPLAILLLGMVVLASSIVPGPIHGPVLIMSGYIFGFRVAFITMYLFQTLGDLLAFAAARRCCVSAASKMVTRHTKLAALAGAVQHGGLKLVLLIKFIPGPPVLGTFVLATFAVPFWQFSIATLIECIPHTAMPVFVGSSAESLIAAITGADSVEGGSVSGATGGSSTIASHLELALMVIGLAAAVIGACVIAAYTRRELRRITAGQATHGGGAPQQRA